MLPKHRKLAVSLTSATDTFELCPHSHDNTTCSTDIVSTVILHQTRCIHSMHTCTLIIQKPIA